MSAPSNSQSSRDIQRGAVRLSMFSSSPIVRAFARQRQAADDKKEPPEPLDPNGAANDVIIVANNDRVIVGEQLVDNPRVPRAFSRDDIRDDHEVVTLVGKTCYYSADP
ncbi:unnamed protein product [Sphagnum jensenii]